MVLLKMYSTYPYTLYYVFCPLNNFENKENMMIYFKGTWDIVCINLSERGISLTLQNFLVRNMKKGEPVKPF